MMTNALLTHQQNDFCIQELTLYLDTHPTDKTALRLLKRHLDIRDHLKKAAEKEVGPLTNTDNTMMTWRWIKGPWPWENEVNDNVDL